ncbi:MAG: hypothetical protein ACI4J0_10060 [Huintestinicola sp.]|uniref:hypothetical protein n=1 Tax=Huintestinicola sp. TaxID=2981661 RepID=UPI003F02597B
MKIIIALLITAVLLTACGGGEKDSGTVVTHAAATMTGEGVLIEETENMEMQSISETTKAAE